MALSIGDVASPDDCWLALRGVRTLGIRLEHQMRAGEQHFFRQRGAERKRAAVVAVLPVAAASSKSGGTTTATAASIVDDMRWQGRREAECGVTLYRTTKLGALWPALDG